MQEASLKKRYLFKLTTNIIGLAIGLAIQAVVPRSLGPKAYGDYNFLTNFFSQITGFLDMGTSMGFYTKLSQRPRESELVAFYLYFTLAAFVLTALFLVASTTTTLHVMLWPGQGSFLVYLAAIWSFLSWLVMILSRMADAYGLTVSAEIVRSGQKFIGLCFILALFLMNQLNIESYFYYQFVLYVLLLIGFLWIFTSSGFPITRGWNIDRRKVAAYFREFYQYSHPLILYAIIGLAVGILDRWLLQVFAGSVEQGFFGLAFQIGAVCFLFTSAMTPLITREFSIAYAQNDIERMSYLFGRYIPMLYAVAAFFSCFLAVEADKVVHLMGGNEYRSASVAVAVMTLYPIHQTYGQLSGSIFYATGHTNVYRNIGIFFMLLGLPVTYLMIAPMDKFGMNAGATGLALKMVILQFFAVNAQLVYNARFLGLSFKKFFIHQLLTVAGFMTAAVLSAWIADGVIRSADAIFTRFFVAGVLYVITSALLTYRFPLISGLLPADIARSMMSFNKMIRGKEQE